MNQIVSEFMKKHQLVDENDHIVVAVSGGPDSMALLHYLNHQRNWKLKLSVAHVEHGLRGETSLKDLQFVQSFCKDHNIPFYYHQPDVKRVKEERGISSQEAARICRYTWFEKLMDDIGANSLALAHHGDDQIETMLMKQVRGGVTSLQGIPVQRPFGKGKLIRPFLCLEKSNILQYCKEKSVGYRVDETNETDTYQRNRFRKYILPFLKEENPQVHQTFQRHSEWTRDENHYLQSQAQKEVEKAAIVMEEDKVSLSMKKFLAIPIPLQRRGVHLILNYLSLDVGRHITVRHIEDILILMNKDLSSGELHLPQGIIVRKSYDKCLFLSKEQEEETFSIIEIPFSGIVPLKKGKIISSVHKKSEELKREGSIFLGDLKKLSTPLYIRPRRQGDRIFPLGLRGSKKIKDIFIDEKIPVDERDQWPIVTDNDGRILWIPSLKRSNIALIDEFTENILMLVFKKDGE
ncbi:tRNA(Ile)-lysidine synthase [Evansella vedderi]|uniref:tRNA(Ile)-lysidine synthase n=1 Tax=Evansella vedderi TaxID=38282 RepID=A0ABU0A310_9BACI|nr:tRNA lysidine(34) synthetase TilS [Evansella vedderi]MDQ0257879.1 tRNA(Ile)-lysidine synthase [Evansella vedderi]